MIWFFVGLTIGIILGAVGVSVIAILADKGIKLYDFKKLSFYRQEYYSNDTYVVNGMGRSYYVKGVNVYGISLTLGGRYGTDIQYDWKTFMNLFPAYQHEILLLSDKKYRENYLVNEEFKKVTEKAKQELEQHL